MPLLFITVQFALMRELTNIFVGYILRKNNRKGHVVEYNQCYSSAGTFEGGECHVILFRTAGIKNGYIYNVGGVCNFTAF